MSDQYVQPGDLDGYTQCHFFAGIGGWSRALRLAGWPDWIPVWTGSCPCHLWPQFRRLIRKRDPAIVFGEQVASTAGRAWLSSVQIDLEKLGYDFGAAGLPACSVGAPHLRQRLWFVAAHGISDADRERFTCRPEETGHEQERPGAWSCAGLPTPKANDSTGAEPMRPRGGGPALKDVAALAATHDHAEGADEQRDRICRQGGQMQAGGHGGVMGDDRGQGLEGHSGDDHSHDEPGRNGAHTSGPAAAPGGDMDNSVLEASGAGSSVFWEECEWLQFFNPRYGKHGEPEYIWRPVEPGLEPLADGVSGRVGKLRGYGNAIVTQAAAQFIAAESEVINGMRDLSQTR